MAKRDILNYLGQKIGEMELPDGTSEDVWAKKLAPFAIAPPSTEQVLESRLQYTIKERKQYAEDMLERFKKRNLLLGIDIFKSEWLHHRMRALECNIPHPLGETIPMSLDIMNLAVSGDVEVAAHYLQYATLDDMTKPWHFFDAATRDWLVNDMKQFLGWP